MEQKQLPLPALVHLEILRSTTDSKLEELEATRKEAERLEISHRSIIREISTVQAASQAVTAVAICTAHANSTQGTEQRALQAGVQVLKEELCAKKRALESIRASALERRCAHNACTE
ncbi:uncharacterized protein LOC113146877 [Cyclospora cayetanensis]|uniref:Uncharacterized protein LOC113146877 n=1 Tax=Cyclospora cayetanensis TaxID=88456 RepID=A0A6P6RW08_9EIME|nr:uncharacterized protein LOC113146877 [Cyclospora cayetanensis]